MSQTKSVQTDNSFTSISEKQKNCDALKQACDTGSVGDMVAAHQNMILQYYQDVLKQAQKSFNLAKLTATVGFFVIIFTFIYIFVSDAHSRFSKNSISEPPITVANVGLLSGTLIEFIASVNFLLYARASKQFNAFHVCLERTNRYLIAYKISEKIQGARRDEVLDKLVCIMAKAPMITSEDFDTSTTLHTKPRRF